MSAASNLSIVTKLAKGLDTVDIPRVVDLVNKFGLYGAARIMGYDISHYNNLLIAGRLAIEDLRNSTPKNLKEYIEIMQPKLNKVTYDFMVKHADVLQEAMNKNADYDYDHDWFSANTMITMYSAIPGYGMKPIETPQLTWMRIAVQFYHDSDNAVNDVITAYEEMSHGWYTPASPTIFNSGFFEPQLSSCYLLKIGDEMKQILKRGIYYGGMISAYSGGLGFDISTVRHSEIRNEGWSDGIVPMLGMYDAMVNYVNQRGRRKGAATIFIRPHHIDIEDFIELPRKVGDKYSRAHNLNFCIWTSWIFWDRIKNDGNWTLFCPAKVPQLNNIYGVEFTKAYIAAENDHSIAPRHKKVLKARELYDKILNVQREAGMPYMMNGDAANLKSNHRHLGYISSSNLCLEVIEFTDKKTIAVCNLHSLSLRMFAKRALQPSENLHAALRDAVDFTHLSYISQRVVTNLNRVIDNNWYPLDSMKNGVVKPKIMNKSNKKHRPVGMGASGFAELLHILDLPFEDPRTFVLNKMIFACMYWNALAQSVQLALNEGVYESFVNSPTSQGLLQFDLWKEEFAILGPNALRKAEDDEPIDPSTWNQHEFVLYRGSSSIDVIKPTWDDLKRCIVKYGLRNSLLIALMPTASTAQVRRNCESVEAHQNNMYSRKVLKCSYPVLNRYLVADLDELNAWNDSLVEFIRVRNGSIQGLSQYIKENPNKFSNFVGNYDRVAYLEKKYRTMWEIPQKVMMKLAADRGRYIDQSSSTNVYIRDCTDDKIRACHLYANMLGLKTIMYYLRTTGGETIKFTADPDAIKHIKGLNVEKNEEKKEKFVCTDEVCTSCT